ncbi:hypothetical protein Vadar_024868 [Vaccinium darrowii]|uniref:Uncharacterized protein n=1 Tax=Vaccinium darrowii TaxID=229202 RepID=A0ACB7ZMB3_9ERIC|nr:hypothetical protein Vadar_024868 [Vaccinium darrowii]
MSQRRWETLDCEEQEEKEQLSEEGFSTWSWRDCNTFIKASEKYCQHEIEGKTSEEVERYAKVFKERYKELNAATVLLIHLKPLLLTSCAQADTWGNSLGAMF